ncbi:MAG: hypothetical protein JWQ27_3044 [Ferruginibacter sp.]|nr:hypothetical protein [Ferruginibacter sp.]
MFYLLFLLYLLAAAYFISSLDFVKKTGLGTKLILLLFLVKIAAGLLIGWISNRYDPLNDYAMLNGYGREEYQLMITHPKEFLINIFYSPYNGEHSGFFYSTASYWNDLKNNIIIKALAICNIFSRGNYYINSIFFNSLGFLGHVALFRLFRHVYPDKRTALMIGSFLLPSTLYFSSAIHKDAVVFTMLGFFCYSFYFTVLKGFGMKRTAVLVTSFLLLLLIRNYVALLLLPCCAGFLLTQRFGIRPVIAYGSMVIAGILVLFFAGLAVPAFNPFNILVQKQADFMNLGAAQTDFPMQQLTPSASSFIHSLPTAANHAFLRPYPWEFPGKLLSLLSWEWWTYLLLFAIYFVINLKKRDAVHPFTPLCLLFILAVFLLIGFITPNAGSLVRYRGLYYPLLMIPVLASLAFPNINKNNI